MKSVLLIYESGPSGRGWKGERVSELISALINDGFRAYFFGLRGLTQAPIRFGESFRCFLFALPGQCSRIAPLFGLSRRQTRTVISQVLFSAITRLTEPRTVLTQTTLGTLIEKLKIRGYQVVAECDMTSPREWKEILLKEGNRIGALEHIKSELPEECRVLQEERAFRAAHRIIVFSRWALDHMPADVRQKSVVIPSISATPCDKPLVDADDARPIEFIFVGQLGFRKGTHLLAEALSNLPEKRIKCHIFGKMRENFLRYMRQLNVEFPNSMHLHGYGDWRKFVRSNPRRYVALLPSFVEGSPRFIYEAAAMGLPAIVAPAAQPSIFVHESEILVMSQPSSVELNGAMIRFLDEPALWGRLSAAVHQTYKAAYQRTSYGKQVSELLQYHGV